LQLGTKVDEEAADSAAEDAKDQLEEGDIPIIDDEVLDVAWDLDDESFEVENIEEDSS
jgi:hypothetical protein